jgi:hypothetical protein
VHSPCHEQMGVRGPTKSCLKPDDDLSLMFSIENGENNDILASFTNIWLDPRLSARMLYPRLCQSMMTLLPRNAPTSHTKARVGMLGGFFAIALYHLAGDSEGAYLHKNELGRGDAPEESAEDGDYLQRYFYGCENDKRQLSERGR